MCTHTGKICTQKSNLPDDFCFSEVWHVSLLPRHFQRSSALLDPSINLYILENEQPSKCLLCNISLLVSRTWLGLLLDKLRATLQYGGEGYLIVHRSWILGEFWNLIGQEWHFCLVVVHIAVKSPLVENFVHGWQNDMVTNVATLLGRGVLWRSSFLGNLKILDKRLGLRRTPTFFTLERNLYTIVLPLWYDTFGIHKNIILSRCRLLINMTNGVKLLCYWGNMET